MTEADLQAKISALEDQVYAAAKSWVPTWAKIAIAIALILLIGAGGVAGYYYLKHDHAVVLTQEQIKSKDALAQALKISQAQAEKLAKEIEEVKGEKPAVTYYVQAPTVQAAAGQVKKDIDSGKSPANVIPADKTVVTANVQSQKVDVYRIQLDKSRWGLNGIIIAGNNEPAEFGAGISYKNKDWAANVGATNRGRAYVMGVKYF